MESRISDSCFDEQPEENKGRSCEAADRKLENSDSETNEKVELGGKKRSRGKFQASQHYMTESNKQPPKTKERTVGYVIEKVA